MIDEAEGLTAIPGRYQQRGSGEYVLCADCNSLLGRLYVPAYSEFAWAVASKLSEAPETVAAMQDISDPDTWPTFSIEFRSSGESDWQGLYPSRIARQALWMLLGVSPPRFPAHRAQLVSLVLDRNERSVPDGIRLGFCFYLSDVARIHGVAGIADLRTGERRVMAEVSHPPLSWVLIVNGPAFLMG